MKASPVWVAVVALVVALAGCSGDDGDKEDEKAKEAALHPDAKRSSTPKPKPTGPVTLTQPLRFLPVASLTPKACPAKAPATSFRDPNGGGCLTVDSAGAFDVTRTMGAEAKYDPAASSWTVQVTLTDADGKKFGDLTAKVSKLTPPKNQIAIVQGKQVLSAPTVISPITGGEVQISGGTGNAKKDTEKLARALGAPQ